MTFTKIKKGYYESCVESLKSQLKQKEAELAEAREEAKRERKRMFWLWYAIGFCLDNKRIAEVREVFKKQLKEKGDDL